jgi:hypothetical protein
MMIGLDRICDGCESSAREHRQSELAVYVIDKHNAMIVDEPADARGNYTCAAESVERFLSDVSD